MKKICHIRCNDKYWEQKNIYAEWTEKAWYLPNTDFYYELKNAKFNNTFDPFISTCYLNEKTLRHYLKILKLWDKTLKIKHLDFRKQIRDIIINDIVKRNVFDIILESNQQCKQYFEKNSSADTIFYQQDDDDIFLFLPEELQPELNIFVYSCIDPIGGRRKPGFRTRADLKKIQSNHCIIYNTNSDIITNSEHKLYEADHTFYDYLKQHYNYHEKLDTFSIQLYHLHSISVWKHMLKFSEKKYTKEDIFLDCVKEYIIKLEEIYIEHNKDVPQLEPLLTLYKKLI